MAKKGRKFSKEHLANLRAAHAARRGKKNKQPKTYINTVHGIELPLPSTAATPVEIPALGIIERFKLAVDAIEEQVKRLETILVSA